MEGIEAYLLEVYTVRNMLVSLGMLSTVGIVYQGTKLVRATLERRGLSFFSSLLFMIYVRFFIGALQIIFRGQ